MGNNFPGLTTFLVIFLVIISACAPRVATFSEYSNPAYDLRGLVTTESEAVQSCLRSILADNNDVRTDFRRIQDWVAANVVYDNLISDYWQKPYETLKTRRGDCKDYSTLLLTLLRAHGIPPDTIYVAIGAGQGGRQHAFLIERYVTGKWQVIEPQVGGFITSGLGAIETAEKYAIVYLFNDKEYSGKPYWIYSKIKGVDIAPVASGRGEQKMSLPQVNYFTITPQRITGGQPATLQWDVSGADYIAIDQGIGQVDPVGMAVIYPLESTGYRLVASNSGGTVNCPVTIKVMQVNGAARLSQPALAADMQRPLTVGFEGWYSGEENIYTAKVGQQLAARINISGGIAGKYILRIWRCLAVGHDDIVSQWAFDYDGIAVKQQVSFAPSYAVGESGTMGYRLDILRDVEQIWAMPEGYPPRLMVAPRPVAGPLVVNFAGWRRGMEAVQSIKSGQGVVGLLTMAGGSPGQFNLQVKRDVEGSNDQLVQQLSFNYDGSSALQGMLFIPEVATGESATRGYYLELYQDNKFIWSQSGAYPPRLKVMK